MQHTKLAEALKEMGFYHKMVNNIRYYYEQPKIIKQRHTYLRRMMQNRADKRPVVYLDEAWANSHDGKRLALRRSDTLNIHN